MKPWVVLSLMAVGGVVLGLLGGVWAGVLWTVGCWGSYWATDYVVEVLFSFFRERRFRRDRLLADYVPARVGNVWLAVGLSGLYVWGAWGYGVVTGSVGPLLLGWVVPSFVGMGVVGWWRARVEVGVFRREVELARDVSVDRRFWEIVNGREGV